MLSRFLILVAVVAAVAAATSCDSDPDCASPSQRCNLSTSRCVNRTACTTTCDTRYGCFKNSTCHDGQCYPAEHPFPGCCYADSDCPPTPCMVPICYKTAGLCVYLDLQNHDCAHTGHCPNGTTCYGDGHATGTCVSDVAFPSLLPYYVARICYNHSMCHDYSLYGMYSGCRYPANDSVVIAPGMTGVCYVDNNQENNYPLAPYRWVNHTCNDVPCETVEGCPAQFPDISELTGDLTVTTLCTAGQCNYSRSYHYDAFFLYTSCNESAQCETLWQELSGIGSPCPTWRCLPDANVPLCWIDMSQCALCVNASDCPDDGAPYVCIPLGGYGYCLQFPGNASLSNSSSSSPPSNTTATADLSSTAIAGIVIGSVLAAAAVCSILYAALARVPPRHGKRRTAAASGQGDHRT